jgi:septal ring factor EnvC (AmiA/AmiB activator)
MDQSRALDDAIDDLPTARALIASLQEQLTKSQREIAALRHELDILCQRLFGKKSERVDPRQLQLALNASSRMGASRSITTAPKTSSVLSRWAARIGYSQAASKAPDARRSSIQSFRAANSSTSRRFCT